MQVGLKLFFLVSNNKPGLEYVCCFTDETLTRAGDVVPEEFWKRAGVRVRRVPGTRGRVGSAQDGKCRMPLFLQKRSIIFPPTEVLGWRGGSPGVWGCPPRDGYPQETPGLSVSEITWAPLEFFHGNLYSFLTNTIKLILWKGALKKPPLLLVERSVSNSFTSSPTTTAQTWASRGHLVFKGCLRFSFPIP